MFEPAPVRIAVMEGAESALADLTSLLARQIGWSVVYSATDAFNAIDTIVRERPDVVIVSETAPGSGLGLVRRICQTSAAPAVLVRLGDAGPEATEEYLRAGARGCVEENAPTAELLRALRRVAAGGIGLSPAIDEALLAHLLAASAPEVKLPEESAPHAALSRRERQVYFLLGKGRTVKEMAQELGLSPQTVAHYRHKLKQKLGLRSSAELTRHATKRFLLGDSRIDDAHEEP
jgi:two-component system NarL family response regulator